MREEPGRSGEDPAGRRAAGIDQRLLADDEIGPIRQPAGPDLSRERGQIGEISAAYC